MASFPWLVDFVALATPAQRADAATRLAHALGADTLLVFLKDAEIDLLLPAPGFVQTLPESDIWQAFLACCVEQTVNSAALPWPTATQSQLAIGIAASADIAFVFLGGVPNRENLDELLLLLPLLEASLRGEYEAHLAHVRAATEREAATRAVLLMQSLDTAHRDLQRAFQEIGDLNARLQRLVVETHHRVKNHLQVLGAMVDLQMMGAGETVSIDEFRRIKVYIRTLSDVHDLLTQTSRAGHLEENAAVKGVLERLVPTLQKAIHQEVRYRFEDVVLPVKKVTSLVLITSELMSNAQKHGQGTIEVTFTVNAGTATLCVEDDGPGFPNDFNPTKAANTGLGLIQAFADFDLRGKVRFATRPQGGGSVVVTFPV